MGSSSSCCGSVALSEFIPDSFGSPYELFAEGKMIEAIPLFQKEIEENLNQDIEIEGLGNWMLAQGYY